jgi:hypothetical protein
MSSSFSYDIFDKRLQEAVPVCPFPDTTSKATPLPAALYEHRYVVSNRRIFDFLCAGSGTTFCISNTVTARRHKKLPEAKIPTAAINSRATVAGGEIKCSNVHTDAPKIKAAESRKAKIRR